ncbi:MAG: hypothetical protein ACLGHY_04490, partial [Gammaproteobacteria bacterium]
MPHPGAELHPHPDDAGGSGCSLAPADRAGALRDARSSVRRARGALVVAGLTGVPVLIEEAGRLIEAIESETVVLDEARLEPFERACHAVGEYIHGLLSGASHRPLYLFPCYRDLMASRGVDRASPADLLP